MRSIKENPIYVFVRKRYWKIRKKFRKPLTKIYRFFTLKLLYPTVYKIKAKRTLKDDKVVFVEIRLSELSNSFSLIHKELTEDYNFNVHSHFLRVGFASRREQIKLATKMVSDISDAKYIIVNEGSGVIGSLPIRQDTIVLQTWHGCGAFKKFGMSTADLIFGDDRKNQEKYPVHKNYTYVTVSSPEVVWAYEDAMPSIKGKSIVKPVGVSRTDIFYDEEAKTKAYNRIYELVPEAKGKKIIMYAPTFRGRVVNAKTSHEFDVAYMHKYLKDDYVVIYKHHPVVKKRPEIPENLEHFAYDLTDDISIEDLIMVSDICISDYSSLVFEYSLFERPMIFFAYDLDDYYDWRGFYYDYYEFVPGPIFSNTNDIVKYINGISKNFDKQKVIDFKNKFMSACDGHATERIMKMTFKEDLDRYRR